MGKPLTFAKFYVSCTMLEDMGITPQEWAWRYQGWQTKCWWWILDRLSVL